MSDVLLESPAAGVALVRLNRPKVHNALNMAVRERLMEVFCELSAAAEIRCIVLTGSSTVFAAGADLREMVGQKPVEMMLRGHRMWRVLAACPKPIIAAVNGYAWGGGCELAMQADIIVAGQGASFAQPEIKVGIMPGAGGLQRLARAVGKFHAMKMVLTGQPVPADVAFTLGLVSEVVKDDAVESRALELARTIAAMPPIAVAQIKEVLLAGQDASLDTALLLERKAFQLLFASEDQKEGMTAFLERRPPVFRGQ